MYSSPIKSNDIQDIFLMTNYISLRNGTAGMRPTEELVPRSAGGCSCSQHNVEIHLWLHLWARWAVQRDRSPLLGHGGRALPPSREKKSHLGTYFGPLLPDLQQPCEIRSRNLKSDIALQKGSSQFSERVFVFHGVIYNAKIGEGGQKSFILTKFS